MRLRAPMLAVPLSFVSACSLLVDVTGLGPPDAQVADATSDADAAADAPPVTDATCDVPLSPALPNPCDGSVLCEVPDGGAPVCVASPSACGGVYVGCLSPKDCSIGSTCCLSATFTTDCPAKMLTIQGTACDPSCNTGSYRVCRTSLDCSPGHCTPLQVTSSTVIGVCQ